MPKLGMNMLLWTTHVTQDHYPLLEKLRKEGFDGVEIPLFRGDEQHFRNLRKELDNLGLKCTTVTVSTDEANPISADAKVRKEALERLVWAVHMTAVLGGDVLCGPIHSALGIFSGKRPTEEERNRSADVLRQVAERAERVGVRIAVEYLNRFECYLLTTAAQTADLVDQVAHPSLCMMWDTFHAHIEEKSVSALKSTGKRVIHVHISENDRGVPGTGQVYWIDTFQSLREIGYDSWYTIESFSGTMEELTAAAKVWRDLSSSEEEVYKEGIKFLKRMLGFPI